MLYVAYLAFERGAPRLAYRKTATISLELLRKLSCICTGRPERLEYAIDSYGNLCGTKNDWDGTNGPDLTLKPKLYYLNPLELLNPATITTAKAICVEACPTATDVCGVANFPCRTAAQYRLAKICATATEQHCCLFVAWLHI